MKKALTLSIIIPVYNEERYLGRCLDAIAAQTLTPDEVVIINNNSTDNTLNVARRYKFVRVINEVRQGVLFASRTGFDAAKGEIICRIDADTIVSANWLEEVRGFFELHPNASAVTGNCYFYDFPFKRLVRVVHHSVYYGLQRRIAGTEILWGSNMALKKNAWDTIRRECSERTDIHEDIDISLHLHANGLIISRWPRMVVEVSLRRGNLNPSNILTYLWPWPKTYWVNKHYGQATVIGIVLAIVWIFALPLGCLVWVIKLFVP